jgi:HD-like signal output (HDOD) protein
VKWTVDEELWYGAGSDAAAEAEAAKSMSARVGRIIGAKPFPIAAQRLMTLTQSHDVALDDVVAVLESDPALSARLLRLVNSVGYSLRTACTSVRHAATLVGIEKLHQVASTAAIIDLLDDGGGHAAKILEHATVVGSLCRYLALHFALPADELFTCGFLHDIGKLMLLDTESDYVQLLDESPPEFDRSYVLERQKFGFDHALLAGHVLAAWHIPDPVPKVVAWHHHVTRAYAESTLISQMVNTLRLADALSFVLDKEDAQAEIERLARGEAASYLDISEPQLAAMWGELQGLADRARVAFSGKAPASQRGVSQRPKAAAPVPANPSLPPSRSIPPTSEAKPARRFPCVVCESPSYAQTCAACGGYVCPEHVDKEEWCSLCRSDYNESGIPRINPVASMAVGAGIGALVAATLLGALLAGTDAPVRVLFGPASIFLLIGVLGGVGHRWARRFWFLRTRPHRRFSKPPKSVGAGFSLPPGPAIESTEDELRAIGEHRRLSRAPSMAPPRIGGSLEPAPPSSARLVSIPPPTPRVPLMNTPLVHAAPAPPPTPDRAKVWMSARPPTPVVPKPEARPVAVRADKGSQAGLPAVNPALRPVIVSAVPASGGAPASSRGAPASARGVPASDRRPTPGQNAPPQRVSKPTVPMFSEAVPPPSSARIPRPEPEMRGAVPPAASPELAPAPDVGPTTRPSVPPHSEWDPAAEPHGQAGGW